MGNKRVPEIRFPGFTDDWEQRKFSEITYMAGEKNKENLPYESYSITNENGFFPQDEQFENGGTMKNANKTMYYIVTPKSFAYNPARINVGSIGYQDLGKNVIVSSLYEVFKTSADVDDRFLWHWFKTDMFRKMIEQYQEGGVRLYFYYDKLCISSIYLPTIEEQAEIGRLFDTLDNLITLHQRKLDNVKSLKAGMLQKMFPKNDEKFPEIRFPGFTDAWEQRKLGEHTKNRRGSFPQPYGNKEWYDGDGAMPFVQVVDVTDHLVLVDDTKQKISRLAQPKSVFVPKGKVVVTLQGSIGRVAITQYDAFVDRTLLIFEDYEKPTDKNFWAYTIQRKFDVEKQKAPGGTIKTITKEALSSFEVSLPEYEEQKKIGDFFARLDNLITLHQQELETLEQTKKAFLQKMFM